MNSLRTYPTVVFSIIPVILLVSGLGKLYSQEDIKILFKLNTENAELITFLNKYNPL